MRNIDVYVEEGEQIHIILDSFLMYEFVHTQDGTVFLIKDVIHIRLLFVRKKFFDSFFHGIETTKDFLSGYTDGNSDDSISHS